MENTNILSLKWQYLHGNRGMEWSIWKFEENLIRDPKKMFTIEKTDFPK